MLKGVKMKRMFMCVVLLAGYCLAVPQPDCLAPSVESDGSTPATCGGFIGQQCPSPTDSCPLLPSSDFGYCCVGCGRNAPSPTVACYSHRDCRRGERCVKPVNNGLARGVCCRNDGGY
ncbi:uncharacterized protein LOC127876129 [Dreissena polymorpha]|uniref:uncharacterized protein LOC127876129 n=1 Tax=Dreissena polymorpha TaxID=45954 RepID=UPI0022653CB0|nr:uncharacterized protein LOC127876129 [Dreissena polymorpha]